MTDFAEVVTFVRARLDDDQQAAPEVHAASCLAVDSSESLYAVTPESCTCGWPNRLLAEVDAKRRLLDEHVGYYGDDFQSAPVDVPRLLALPYAGHPDYQPEWRPA